MPDDAVADEETKIINLVKDKCSISEEVIQTIQETELELQKVHNKVYESLFLINDFIGSNEGL